MKTILHCDDSEVCRLMARHHLEEAGYTVVSIDTPLALSTALGTHRPDLVLIDVQMPALSGDQAISIVKRHGLHACPFLLYSDRPTAELQMLARRVGAAGYVHKSAEGSELVRAIERAMEPPR